jgi:flagellar hook-length control protein FliK
MATGIGHSVEPSRIPSAEPFGRTASTATDPSQADPSFLNLLSGAPADGATDHRAGQRPTEEADRTSDRPTTNQAPADERTADDPAVMNEPSLGLTERTRSADDRALPDQVSAVPIPANDFDAGSAVTLAGNPLAASGPPDRGTNRRSPTITGEVARFAQRAFKSFAASDDAVAGRSLAALQKQSTLAGRAAASGHMLGSLQTRLRTTRGSATPTAYQNPVGKGVRLSADPNSRASGQVRADRIRGRQDSAMPTMRRSAESHQPLAFPIDLPGFDRSGELQSPAPMSEVERVSSTRADTAESPTDLPIHREPNSAAQAARSNAALAPRFSDPPPVDVAAVPQTTIAAAAIPSERRVSSTAVPLSTPPRAVEHHRLMQRITNSFVQLGDRGGQIRMRLHPEALGTMHLEIQFEGRQLTARIEVENDAARELLRDALPELHQRLAELGIEIEHCEIEQTAQESTSGQGSQQGSQAAPQRSEFPSRQRRHQSTDSQRARENLPDPSATRPVNGALNLLA